MNDPTKRPLADLLADFEASDAEVDAGHIVPADEVIPRLRESLRRLRAEQAEALQHGYGPRM